MDDPVRLPQESRGVTIADVGAGPSVEDRERCGEAVERLLEQPDLLKRDVSGGLDVIGGVQLCDAEARRQLPRDEAKTGGGGCELHPANEFGELNEEAEYGVRTSH
jgi:hypothetical protein